MKSTSTGPTVTDQDLSTFFSEYSLYRKIEYCDNLSSYHSLKFPEDFEGKAFQYYCPVDKDHRTFKIHKPELLGYFQVKPNEISFLYLDKGLKLNISFPLNGHCQFCDFKMNFLINAFTLEQAQWNTGEFPTIYIRKIGQFPAPEINPEKNLREFLTEEDVDFYKKARQNLNFSYGIGAFAYFRRIIENEIINVANRLINTNENSKTTLESELKEYREKHQMSRLINALTPYLPKSVLIKGENPLGILYGSVSNGIHNLSEEDCASRSQNIEILLKHVIVELRNNESQKDIQQAFKNLRDGQ